jgi:hypothetical protein
LVTISSEWLKVLLYGLRLLIPLEQKKDKRRKLGILYDFWWAIWKERNRRIFDNIDRSPNQLTSLLKDDIILHLSVMVS